MKKQLYLDIKNRLKTIKDANDEPLFKHFDLWNQQVEFIEQETPFQCPAIFVEFLTHHWKTLGNKVQETELFIRLHIVTEWFAQTADYSATEEQALDYLDIVDAVVAVMQNFSATGTNGFMRTKTIPNHNHERFVDNIEEYVCNLRDTSAVNVNKQPVKVNVVLTKYKSLTIPPDNDDSTD